MEKDKKELNVDYIGGQGPLTLAEEAELSEYFKKKKIDSKKSKNKEKLKPRKQSKVGT